MGTSTEYFIGKRERLSWIQETSYGSGGTMSNGEVVGYNAAISGPDFDKVWQELLTAGADSRAVAGLAKGRDYLPFTLQFTVTNWRWLKYLFNVADSGSGPYTHTFSIANTVNSFKLEWARYGAVNNVITLTGCVALNAKLTVKKPSGEGAEGLILCTLQCIGQATSRGTSVTSLSALSAAPFLFRHMTFTFNNNAISEVIGAEINISNGINPDDSLYCNATYNGAIGDPIPTVFRLDGRTTINIKDDRYEDAWDTEAAVSNCSLSFVRAVNDQMVFTFGGFYPLKAFAPTNQQGGVTVLDLLWKDVGASSTFVATDSVSPY